MRRRKGADLRRLRCRRRRLVGAAQARFCALRHRPRKSISPTGSSRATAQSRSHARSRVARRGADRHRRLRHQQRRLRRCGQRPAPMWWCSTTIRSAAPLPAAVAVVNPNRDDDLSGQGHLCRGRRGVPRPWCRRRELCASGSGWPRRRICSSCSTSWRSPPSATWCR